MRQDVAAVIPTGEEQRTSARKRILDQYKINRQQRLIVTVTHLPGSSSLNVSILVELGDTEYPIKYN